jgi:thiamine biosynthesis lipoprotein
MLAVTDSDDPAVAVRLRAVPHWFEGWEERLSRFRPQSELMRLNRSAPRRFVASITLRRSLAAALNAARATGGLVTPTLLGDLVAAGYDRSFEQLGDVSPSASAMPPAGTRDWRRISINADGTIQLPPGLQIDLGGTAKGWAADRAARRLGRTAPALIDAGGDIALSGPRADGAPWPIGVADPHNPERDLMLLGVLRGGVATSGRDYRRWRRGDDWRHHIIDPRTGNSAASDIFSATVVAPSALAAEAAAKAALILGSRAGMAWIEARPELAAVLVLEDGALLRSTRLTPLIWRIA